MIGLLVTGHANFGSGLTSSLNLIAGEQEHYKYVDFLPEYSLDDLSRELTKAMDELKDCEGILDVYKRQAYKEGKTMATRKQVEESVSYLQGRLPFAPEIGLVLGSGLGPLAYELEDAVHISYGDIPHFKTSTAPDHAGKLVCGTLAGKRVLCMQAVSYTHLPRAIKQLPARCVPQCGGQPGKGRRNYHVQCTQPGKRALHAESGCTDADPREHPYWQGGKPRLHSRQHCIPAASRRGEQQAQPFDPRAAQPRCGKQGYVIHQYIRAKQHIQINDHAAPPPEDYLITAAAQYLANRGRPVANRAAVRCPKPSWQMMRDGFGHR